MLLNQPNAIVDSPTDCDYYIIDKTATTPDRPDLSATDKLVNAAAYKDPSDLCPIAWDYNGTYCIHEAPSVCYFCLLK